MPVRDHGAPSVSWFGGLQPGTPTGTGNIYVGEVFEITAPGRLFGVALYRTLNDTHAHWAHITDNLTNELLRTYYFKDVTGPATGGWQQTWIRPALRLTPNNPYNLLVAYPLGNWCRLANAAGVRNGITFISSFQTTQFDPTVGGFTLGNNANGVDVLIQFD
jgi:uncharacterized protein DUF4082